MTVHADAAPGAFSVTRKALISEQGLYLVACGSRVLQGQRVDGAVDLELVSCRACRKALAEAAIKALTPGRIPVLVHTNDCDRADVMRVDLSVGAYPKVGWWCQTCGAESS